MSISVFHHPIMGFFHSAHCEGYHWKNEEESEHWNAEVVPVYHLRYAKSEHPRVDDGFHLVACEDLPSQVI